MRKAAFLPERATRPAAHAGTRRLSNVVRDLGEDLRWDRVGVTEGAILERTSISGEVLSEADGRVLSVEWLENKKGQQARRNRENRTHLGEIEGLESVVACAASEWDLAKDAIEIQPLWRRPAYLPRQPGVCEGLDEKDLGGNRRVALSFLDLSSRGWSDHFCEGVVEAGATEDEPTALRKAREKR